MLLPILLTSFIVSINAASIVSRSQSYPLPQPGVLGPQTSITIGNKLIAPDGFERSWVYSQRTQVQRSPPDLE